MHSNTYNAVALNQIQTGSDCKQVVLKWWENRNTSLVGHTDKLQIGCAKVVGKPQYQSCWPY